MPDGQAAFSREAAQWHLFLHACAHQLLYAPLLPCGESAAKRARDGAHATIYMRDMGTERQCNVVQEQRMSFSRIHYGGKQG